MWDIPSNFDITINGKETVNKPMTSNSFLTLLKNCLTISRNTIFQFSDFYEIKDRRRDPP